MKILGLVVARGGSKGLPGKNIKLIEGKPLISYTIKKVLSSKLLSYSILSSDDAEIIKISKKYNLNVPFIRPESLSGDNIPTILVVEHAIKCMLKKNKPLGFVIDSQRTLIYIKNTIISNWTLSVQ